MTLEEREKLLSLKPLTKIYRGTDAEYGDDGIGLSWTLDRDMAVYFAKIYLKRAHKTPAIWTAHINRPCEALAYLEGESEIIINPSTLHLTKSSAYIEIL